MYTKLIGALSLVFLCCSFATANQLILTRVQGTYSGGGGEFNLTPTDLNFVGGVPALNDVSLQTFCMEFDEHVTAGTGVYDYVVNTGAVEGGVGGFDPLDPLTAWMYDSFVQGTLIGYDYGAGREASAAALQNAIWYVEGETPSLTSGQAFYDQAVVADPQGIGKVRVLNLYKDGERAQDQVFEVPEPNYLVMFLTGVFFAAMILLCTRGEPC